MNLLIIQSISDIVTNSSSEVFVLDTDKTCEQVNEILNSITEGFEFPQIFHLKEYREWRKMVDGGELENTYSGGIFEIVKDWFIDPENENDVYNFKIDFLFYPWSILPESEFVCYSSDTFLPVHEAFVEYINDNLKTLKKFLPNIQEPLDKQSYFEHKYEIMSIPDKYIKNFIDNYKESVYGWELALKDNVENLDRKLLVVSTTDNSIPYNTWNTICEEFKGFHKHLG